MEDRFMEKLIGITTAVILIASSLTLLGVTIILVSNVLF